MSSSSLPVKDSIAITLLITLLIMCSNISLVSGQEKKVNFAREILPILSNKCFVCHGPDTKDDELTRLDNPDNAGVNREHLEKSEILERIVSEDDPMPPEEAEKKLTDNERQLIKRWILEGGKYEQHWAFVPPIKTRPQSHPDATLSAAIDALIEDRLVEDSITFAPQADRPTLARRVALILTGLPPEPEMLARFLNDNTEQAYEKLVEELLASPRFGEHQARYWLDAVRYGDTHGLHLDNRRGIFPYRDWVVRALNNNLPFDDFITWQLAGDLLPNPTTEQKIATGYVRMNPSTAEGGAIPAEFQAKNNFDRTETLGTVFLGMSLTCARCHTHKYDPIPQKEYYELFAFFNSTAEPSMDGNKYEYGPVLKVPPDQDSWRQWQELETSIDAFVASASEIVNNSNEIADELKKKWTDSSSIVKLSQLADEKTPFAKLEIHTAAKELNQNVKAAQEKFVTTLVTKDLPKPRETKLLERGEYNLPIGEVLQPGILKVMGELPDGAPRNRLGLAQWLTSRDHPLVSRVLLNQIWMRTFGEGLVRTPEDFGLQGQQPTHPELLDWLAVEFQESGWDLKHMLRLMVNSRTFKQDSAWRKGIDDPENRLWARGPGFRLDAEVLRDLALWGSELLDPTMGGEGVKPYQPPGMWLAMAHPGSNTKNYVPDKDSRLYRRSLYVYWKRTSPHPMMTLFDAPSREASCIARSRTNTSLQSLGLLNETQRIEMGRMFAERLIRECKTDSERIDRMYKLIACRPPNDQERKVCEALFLAMRERYENDEKSAVELLSIGEVKRDDKLNPVEHAAMTQVVVTFLASDVAILLY